MRKFAIFSFSPSEIDLSFWILDKDSTVFELKMAGFVWSKNCGFWGKMGPFLLIMADLRLKIVLFELKITILGQKSLF